MITPQECPECQAFPVPVTGVEVWVPDTGPLLVIEGLCRQCGEPVGWQFEFAVLELLAERLKEQGPEHNPVRLVQPEGPTPTLDEALAAFLDAWEINT